MESTQEVLVNIPKNACRAITVDNLCLFVDSSETVVYAYKIGRSGYKALAHN